MINNIKNEMKDILLCLDDLNKEINYLRTFYDEPLGVVNRKYFRDVLYGDYFEVYLSILGLIKLSNRCQRKFRFKSLKEDAEGIVRVLNNFDEIFLE